MAQQLKNTLSFSLATGESVVLPHELQLISGTRLAPDIIFIPSPDLAVESDTVNVTLTNSGPEMSGAILVEAWHTIERAFGAESNVDLPVKPYVVVSVEGEGQPPIPAFPVPNVQTIIYARPVSEGGNDATGTGTLAKPYRTLQRAVRDVPYIQMPGYRYTVDVSRIGVEILPDGYTLPSWISGLANDGEGFAVTINADHDLALGPTDSVINAGVMNTDPDTGMYSIDDPSKAYTPGALKGLFFFGTTDEGDTLSGVVHENTATEVFVTSNEGGDFTFPFKIKKCSATLQGASTSAFSGMISDSRVHSLAVNGLAVIPLDPEDTGFCHQGGYVWFTGCHLFNPRINKGIRFAPLEACNIVGEFPALDSETYLKSSRVAGCTEWLARSANEGLNFFRGTCIDGCTTITVGETTSVNSNGRTIGGSMMMSNVLIKNMIGDAIYWPGGNASLVDVKIQDSVANGPDSPGDAFVGEGGLLAYLDHVTGTGNAGVGIHAFNGAQIDVTSTTTVTGAAVPSDIQLGGNAPVAYPAPPYNLTEPATFTRVFDPTFA